MSQSSNKEEQHKESNTHPHIHTSTHPHNNRLTRFLPFVGQRFVHFALQFFGIDFRGLCDGFDLFQQRGVFIAQLVQGFRRNQGCGFSRRRRGRCWLCLPCLLHLLRRWQHAE